MVSSLGNFASRALDLRNKADATLKGGFLSRMFGSKQDRADEAKDLYVQAANAYKHSKDPENAVEMYMKCIECEPDDGFKANFYRDASRVIAASDT